MRKVLETPIQPLDPSGIDAIDAQGTLAERVLNKIPLLGWWVADTLWSGRNWPFRKEYESQVEGRADTSDLWGADPFRREVASVVCEEAKVGMPWPNAHFIPDDPFRVVFWSYYDGLDLECAMMKIEDKLGIDIKEEHIGAYLEGTLGEFADDLCSRVVQAPC